MKWSSFSFPSTPCVQMEPRGLIYLELSVHLNPFKNRAEQRPFPYTLDSKNALIPL